MSERNFQVDSQGEATEVYILGDNGNTYALMQHLDTRMREAVREENYDHWVALAMMYQLVSDSTRVW